MTTLRLFEEIRFIAELVIAEQLFARCFAKKKENFIPKAIIGFVILCVTAICYIPICNWLEHYQSYRLMNIFSVSWYISLVILSLLHVLLCYKITISDTLFLGIAGYALQHIEYVVVNEVVAMGIFSSVRSHLWLYALLCVITTFAWYYVILKIFSVNLKACGGRIYEDKPTTILYFLLILVILFISAFMCQNIYLNGSNDYSNVNYQGAITDFFNCSLVLVVQFSIFRINTLNREKEIVKQLLYERQKQYKMSKENIEIINHKCHDLKHQIHALKQANSDELDHYIQDVEKSIMIYDSVVKTDHEVLNTILSEKSLYCEKHQIRLSCIVDSAPLDFMSTLDIYALLGNALDNAIECVSKYKDKEKRVVSLTISSKGSFLCIQTNNYYDGELKLENGLPKTTKKNQVYHGYGMKSMKHITEKYGGSLCTSLETGIFMLQIVIPIQSV